MRAVNSSIETLSLSTVKTSQRLLSLDFMRGFIMVLLALESAQLYEVLLNAAEGSFFEGLLLQFTHHPWHGLRFWDLIQPAFMYIAGVSLALSLMKQEAAGVAWNESFKKMLKRSAWLFCFGLLVYAITPDGLNFRLTNVLTQLSITLLISFLIFHWSSTAQILMCIALLLLREVLYRYTNIEGYDQPFTNQHNFGNYVDLVLTGKIISQGWVSSNWLPTAVHTIAGSLTGRLVMSEKEKVKTLLFWGLVVLILGIGLDVSGVTPVIKRIATSSFTLVSLGICLWAYTFCYWWIDVKQHRKYLEFFTIVGMNSIFIYLFFEIVGLNWFNDYVFALTGGLMSFVSVPSMISVIISSLCVFALEWGLCYFLYTKKIFFRL